MRNITALDRGSLICELQRVRGREIPIATFYRWLSVCGIEPKSWYDDREQKVLKGLVVHLRLGGSAKEYQDHLIEELKAHAQTRTPTRNQTIDVSVAHAD